MSDFTALFAISLICIFINLTVAEVQNEDNACFAEPFLPCGSVIRNNSIIRSPTLNNESRLYPPNSFCQWIIEAPLDYSLLLDFKCFFHIDGESETGCRDKLRLDFGFNTTANICGASLDIFGNQSIPLPLNHVTLEFISDSSTEYAGFFLEIKMVAPPMTTTGTVETIASTVQLTEPSSIPTVNVLETMATTIKDVELSSNAATITEEEVSSVFDIEVSSQDTSASRVTVTSSSGDMVELTSQMGNSTMLLTASSTDNNETSTTTTEASNSDTTTPTSVINPTSSSNDATTTTEETTAIASNSDTTTPSAAINPTSSSNDVTSSSTLQTVCEEITTQKTGHSTTGPTFTPSQQEATSLFTDAPDTTTNQATTAGSSALVSKWSQDWIYVLIIFLNIITNGLFI